MAEYVSADGSPLALYLALPAGEVPVLVHRAIRPASSILELGSGPGRLTRVLLALGHRVTAVDDSAEMLEHVTGADRVCADAFNLDLGRTFDVVLAASHLINQPGESSRSALLQVGRRHLRGGMMLIERYPPGWLLTASAGGSHLGPVRVQFEPGLIHDGVRQATMTYQLESVTWHQTFHAEDVSDQLLEQEAKDAGLEVLGYIDENRCWAKLGVASAPGVRSPTASTISAGAGGGADLLPPPRAKG
jgi:SAM-dependent methyltransferase